MKVIATNRNKKDFQSMIFETDLTWNELKESIINKKDIGKHITKATIEGLGTIYPKVNSQQILINDERHFSIRYREFEDKQLKNYWVITELFKILL